MSVLSTLVWVAFAAVTIAVGLAMLVFALDWMPVDRWRLRVGAVSPRLVEKLARSKRNRWLAITALVAGVGLVGASATDRDVELLASLIGLGSTVTCALAAHFHRIVALARNPESVVSACADRIVVDCEFLAPGRMRITPLEYARLTAGEPTRSDRSDAGRHAERDAEVLQ